MCSSARARATSRPSGSNSSPEQTTARSFCSSARPTPGRVQVVDRERGVHGDRIFGQRAERGESGQRVEHRRERSARERADPVVRLRGRVIAHLDLAAIGVGTHDRSAEPVAEGRMAREVVSHALNASHLQAAARSSAVS
jgi:hypothetical protein